MGGKNANIVKEQLERESYIYNTISSEEEKAEKQKELSQMVVLDFIPRNEPAFLKTTYYCLSFMASWVLIQKASLKVLNIY